MFSPVRRLLTPDGARTIDRILADHGGGVGSLPEEDAYIYAALLAGRSCGRVLHMGTFLGYSLVIAADIARQVSTSPQVVTVDHSAESNGKAKLYCDAAGLDFVGYITASSLDEGAHQAALAGAPWDCVFLDTDHTYETTRAELAAYAPMAEMVLLHDVGVTANQQPHIGVLRAAREYAQAHGWDLVVFDGRPGQWGVAALTRRKDA